MNQTYVKKTFAGRIFDICNIVFMLFLAFIMIFPFWNQFIMSFNDGLDTMKGSLYFAP